jgi:hypothetical protein
MIIRRSTGSSGLSLLPPRGQDFRKQLEESKKIAAGEDLSELEKDLKVYLHEKGSYDKKAFEELFTDKQPEDAGEAEE